MSQSVNLFPDPVSLGDLRRGLPGRSAACTSYQNGSDASSNDRRSKRGTSVSLNAVSRTSSSTLMAERCESATMQAPKKSYSAKGR